MSLLGNIRMQGRDLSPHGGTAGSSGYQNNGHEPPTMPAEERSNDDEQNDVRPDSTGSRSRPTPQADGDGCGATASGEVEEPQGTATSRMAASLASPIPETLSRSSMVSKGPRASR